MTISVDIPERVYGEFSSWCSANNIEEKAFVYDAFYEAFMLKKWGDLNVIAHRKPRNEASVEKVEPPPAAQEETQQRSETILQEAHIDCSETEKSKKTDGKSVVKKRNLKR